MRTDSNKIIANTSASTHKFGKNMPCHDPRDSADFQFAEDSKQIKAQQIEIDLLTRRLCSACQLLEQHNINIPEELAMWWMPHKANDAQMRFEAQRMLEAQARKEQRERYLASVRDRLLGGQLTPDELAALGIEGDRK